MQFEITGGDVVLQQRLQHLNGARDIDRANQTIFCRLVEEAIMSRRMVLAKEEQFIAIMKDALRDIDLARSEDSRIRRDLAEAASNAASSHLLLKTFEEAFENIEHVIEQRDFHFRQILEAEHLIQTASSQFNLGDFASPPPTRKSKLTYYYYS